MISLDPTAAGFSQNSIRSLLFLACLAVSAGSSPGASSPAGAGTEQIFDVRQFGAKGDGKALDTEAVQKALDQCGVAGGVVRVPAGTYLVKPLFLRSRTTLQVDSGATLLATDEPDDFRNTAKKGVPVTSASFFALINGKGLTNVVISGSGTIDGAGARWWIPAEAARRKTPGYTLPRPRLVLLNSCKDVRIKDITLQNSPSFHLVPTECEDVVITNVTVKAPAGSPNTDAIDPSLCRNVLITKCHLDVGDDNVAIKSGRRLPGREFACENITVTECTFLHGHGMSIGSETAGGVRNVIVRGCTFEGTENGLRIKSQRGKGGVVENISYSHITMRNVDPAITFTCYYMTNSAKDSSQPALPKEDAPPKPGPATPVYRHINISDLSATCERSAGLVLGLPESVISNVVFENVKISAATGLTIKNAKGVQLKNVEIKVQNGAPFLVEDATVEGLKGVE